MNTAVNFNDFWIRCFVDASSVGGPSRQPAVNTNFSDMEPLVVEFPTPLTGEFVFFFSLISDAGYEGLKLKAYINENNTNKAFSISQSSATEVSFQHLDSTYSRTLSAQLTKDCSQSYFFTQLIKLVNVSSMRISGAGTLLQMKRAEPVLDFLPMDISSCTWPIGD